MIPQLTYKIQPKIGRGFGYRDYENTVFLGFPIHTVERSINHEVLHHVFFHTINEVGVFSFSAMRFDWLDELDFPEDWDLFDMFEAGIPIFCFNKDSGKELSKSCQSST